jgi:hypothetical protein
MRYLGVHRIWRQVDITGPGNRAGIDIDTSEEVHVEQWPKGACQIFAIQPYTALQSIF